MKIRIFALGLLLGAAALVASTRVHAAPTHPTVVPVPLCPPDQPGCSLNQ